MAGAYLVVPGACSVLLHGMKTPRRFNRDMVSITTDAITLTLSGKDPDGNTLRTDIKAKTIMSLSVDDRRRVIPLIIAGMLIMTAGAFSFLFIHLSVFIVTFTAIVIIAIGIGVLIAGLQGSVSMSLVAASPLNTIITISVLSRARESADAFIAFLDSFRSMVHGEGS